MENNDIGLIVLKGYKDREKQINDYICELTGEDKDYIIDVSSPRFSNGEAKVQINETVRNKDIYIIADVGNYNCTYKIYNYENHMSPDEHYLDVIRAISAIGGKARRITLILPLMYASRQHRRNGRESLDCAMALRYFESLGVNDIITFDVHDEEIQNTIPTGSFDTIFPLYSILKKFVTNEKDQISKEKMVVISPDVGAMKRAKKYASILNLDIGLFYKRRDYTKIVNGKNPIVQHEYIGPDIKDKNLLIIDDMLSSGESVLDIAKTLKERGCKNVYVATTFAFFTDGFKKFDEAYKEGLITKVYSTNASFITEELRNKEWFCEINLTKFIGKIIVALNKNQGLGSIIEPIDKMNKLLSLINIDNKGE